MHFTVGPVQQATEVMIDSPDVMGVVRLPLTDRQPIDARFARIHWSGKGSDLSPDPDARQDKAIMDAIPWLRFSCVDCRFGELPLGEVKGSWSPVPTGSISRGWRCAWPAAPCAAAPSGWRVPARCRPGPGSTSTPRTASCCSSGSVLPPHRRCAGQAGAGSELARYPYRLSLPTLAGSADYQLEGGPCGR